MTNSFVAIAIMLCMAQAIPGRSQDASTAADPLDSMPETDVAEWLFVQSAISGEFDGENLTLHNVPPTFFFSDRPLRLFGHIKTAKLAEQASVGENNFRTNPPNAMLSFLNDDAPGHALVTLHEPSLEGDNITYPVKVLSGKIPRKFKQATLFIDSFGHHGHHGGHHPHVGAAIVAGAVIGSAVADSTPQTVYVQPSTVYVPAATTTAAPTTTIITVTNTVVVQNPDVYAHTKESSNPAPAASTTPPKTASDKLKGLKSMQEQGLISKDQYDDKAEDLLKQYNPTPGSMNLQDALGGLKALQTQGLITEKQYEHKSKEILEKY